MQWRWLEDRRRDPWETMAVDDLLFQEIIRNEAILPILRAYQWDRPCVSIGRLQDEKSVRALYPDLPLVRRPTGGRAVVHGADLTFAVVTRADWLPASGSHGVLTSYRQIMVGFVQALLETGTSAQMGDHGSDPEDRIHCFAHVALCDVADAETGRKLIGSAQRRENGVILQQMTIPEGIIRDPASFLDTLSRTLSQSLAIEGWQRINPGEN